MTFHLSAFSKILLSSLLLAACGTKEIDSKTPQQNSISSVSIPQTEVRDQLSIGYCWAYTGIALLESKLKSEIGQQFNLSEEALGFYRIIEELSYYTKVYQSTPFLPFSKLSSVVRESSFEEWRLKRDPTDKSFPVRDTLDLIEFYGVIPENVWSVKFTSPARTEQMTETVKSAYLQLIEKKGRSAEVTTADYIEILSQPNAFGSVPPSSFVHNGRLISSQSFVKDVAKFRASDFASIKTKTSRDLPKLVTAMKQTLARGISVPVLFGLNFSFLKNGSFSFPNRPDSEYDRIPEKESQISFAKDGGHTVLITDFVNNGGREGTIPAPELQVELSKNSEELSYVKAKNSWGLNAASNEGGIPIVGAKDGYYRIDLGYLKGAADAAFLSIVVPTGIASAIR